MRISILIFLFVSLGHAEDLKSENFCKILERTSLALNDTKTVKHNSQDIEKISNYAHLLKTLAPKCNEVRVMGSDQSLRIIYKEGFSITTDTFNFQKNGKVVSWQRGSKDGSVDTLNF